ncbi:MAG: glycosyltransferase family A protein [Eggerthellales bacterium]|nr:glycosyltransferase family A protein [Eggerthellales bacterium]
MTNKHSQDQGKLISFVVPCYNSAEYLDACVESILKCPGNIEVILVNDGSTKDNTSEKIHAWEDKYPGTVVAIDQENKGHGGAINTGLAAATGLYFKVVDSDDWLDEDALIRVSEFLQKQAMNKRPIDMLVANYVYEKVYENEQAVIRYTNIFPEGTVCSWDDLGRFRPNQYLLMHSIIYRTRVLRDCNLQIPEHCFYVDNIFVYVPLPQVKLMAYLNVDLYRYFIGREDQSVNEKVMLSRIDQQLRITRFMIDAVDLNDPTINKKTHTYMVNYLSMMMCICSVFLRMKNDEEGNQKLKDIWAYLKNRDEGLYKKVRHHAINMGTNIPTKIGRKIGLGGYHLAQKIFKFN